MHLYDHLPFKSPIHPPNFGIENEIFCFLWFGFEFCYLFFIKIFMQGITNTVGAVPGIVGVALTGYLLDLTHSWSVSYHYFTFHLHGPLLVHNCIFPRNDLHIYNLQISLFAPSILFYLTGTVVWLTFASSKPQSFSKRD